jgi:hypothetical protein
MEQAQQSSERLFVSTGQAARHCQASIPALKRWIRDGWLVAFKTPEGHCRKELEGCSAPSDSMGYFSAQSLHYIFVSLFPMKAPPSQNFSQTYSLMTYGASISTPQRMGMTFLLQELMRVWPNRFGSGMCGLSWQSIRVLVWPVVPTEEQPTAGEDMNANGLPQHLAEVEDDDILDTAAHQWLERDIFTRTHVVGQSSECPQEWKSVSIP